MGRRQANGYKLRTTPGTSRDIIDNNSYIEVNIDQTNVDAFVKNEPDLEYADETEELASCINTEIKEEPVQAEENEEALKFFQCNRCDYKTKRRYEMKNHIAANHFGVRYKCDMCDYEGKRKDKL